MHLNHELYQQFLRGKNRQPHSLRLRKRRALLSGFIGVPDSPALTLQSSVPFLRQLGVIMNINSVDHIIGLMETRQSNGWQGTERQLSECRLIYFLWDVIAQQQVQVREFKELLMILAGEPAGRVQAIEAMFGEKQQILELVETWDRIFWQQSEPFQEQINDISIIKSKNEGNIGDNKENQQDQANIGFGSSRRLNSKGCRSGSNLEKSYQKRSAKTGIDRSNSAARINSRRSDGRSSIVSRMPELNCFSESDSLSVAEEQKLVERLYDYGKYKQREELKRKLEEERIKVELRQCTFKPQVCNGSRVKPVKKQVKGYGRAVQRMKLGYQKKAQLQRNLQYRAWQQNGSNVNYKPTVTMAPRFHSRMPKEERTELFELKFTLGKMIIPVRVRESDSVEQLVEGVGRIYSLKEHEKVYIRQSIFQAMQQYWIALQTNQNQQAPV